MSLTDEERDEALAQIAELERYLERARGDAEWRPIETAPRDGTPILLCSGDRVTAGHWEPERFPSAPEYNGTTGEYLGQFETGEVVDAWWYSEDGGFDGEHPPTHWMPLPTPPSIDAAISKESK
jgi:hypothetical protein